MPALSIGTSRYIPGDRVRIDKDKYFELYRRYNAVMIDPTRLDDTYDWSKSFIVRKVFTQQDSRDTEVLMAELRDAEFHTLPMEVLKMVTPRNEVMDNDLTIEVEGGVLSVKQPSDPKSPHLLVINFTPSGRGL